MLLHLGHGSILSGFFRVVSCEVSVLLCSSFLEVFKDEVSLSTEGVLELSLLPYDVVGSFESSAIWSEVSSLSEVSSFPEVS